jgi:hypothetical protein
MTSFTTLTNEAASLTLDAHGGSLVGFRLRALPEVNTLSWQSSPQAPGVYKGHFLCLDRWGPPSTAEQERGMSYHGEASQVAWTMLQPCALALQSSAKLPMAGLTVKRDCLLARTGAAFALRERVCNDNQLGRIYNMVQHPTIAPPFLAPDTVVDCNGERGFSQPPASPAVIQELKSSWPQACSTDSSLVDLRRSCVTGPDPAVASFLVSAESSHGWVTAATPSRGLLLGYVWSRADYPWIHMWRHIVQGDMIARGLEFGTAALHQPFPVLARAPQIAGQPLFAYLDAGEEVSRSCVGFLLAVPADYRGTASVVVAASSSELVIRESGADARVWTISIAGLEQFITAGADGSVLK